MYLCVLCIRAHPVPSPGLENTYHRPCSACLIAVCDIPSALYAIRIFVVQMYIPL